MSSFTETHPTAILAFIIFVAFCEGKFDMSGYERNAMRALGTLEVEQVGGGCPSGCPMGANCNCPSATQSIKGAGASTSVWTVNCAGYAYENGHPAVQN